MSELLDSLSSQCTDLLAERPHSLISTLSPALDSVLDGGLELGACCNAPHVLPGVHRRAQAKWWSCAARRAAAKRSWPCSAH